MRKTIAQVQQQFLDRAYPAHTLNLHADETGRLLSYGWYEIARWVRQCRLHGNNCPDLGNPNSNGCPCARTRLIVRNNGPRSGWYSQTTRQHAHRLIHHPDAQLAQEVTPKSEGSMRL